MYALKIYDLRGDIVVRFVDFGQILDDHYLNFLNVKKTPNNMFIAFQTSNYIFKAYIYRNA
jgi:hypothetical protein